MKSSRAHYQSYLLRLWREDAHAPWRASLQSTTTEHIMHFADIGVLFAFLEEQMSTPPDDGHTPPLHLPRADGRA